MMQIRVEFYPSGSHTSAKTCPEESIAILRDAITGRGYCTIAFMESTVVWPQADKAAIAKECGRVLQEFIRQMPCPDPKLFTIGQLASVLLQKDWGDAYGKATHARWLADVLAVVDSGTGWGQVVRQMAVDMLTEEFDEHENDVITAMILGS